MRKTFKPGAIFAAAFFLGAVFWNGGAVFADPEPAADVYVDSSYSDDTGGGNCGTHTCSLDGFKTIGAAVAKVAPGGQSIFCPELMKMLPLPRSTAKWKSSAKI